MPPKRTRAPKVRYLYNLIVLALIFYSRVMCIMIKYALLFIISFTGFTKRQSAEFLCLEYFNIISLMYHIKNIRFEFRQILEKTKTKRKMKRNKHKKRKVKDLNVKQMKLWNLPQNVPKQNQSK